MPLDLAPLANGLQADLASAACPVLHALACLEHHAQWGGRVQPAQKRMMRRRLACGLLPACHHSQAVPRFRGRALAVRFRSRHPLGPKLPAMLHWKMKTTAVTIQMAVGAPEGLPTA
jgi:hypothetical protein